VAPGLREPAVPTAPESTGGDPAEGPGDAPSSPTAPNLGEGGPSGGAPSLPGSAGHKRRSADHTTWETWWELNRAEFLPKRYTGAVVSPEDGGLVRKGPQHLNPDIIQSKVWPVLVKAARQRHDFVREAALIALGRVAANEAQRTQARAILLEALEDRNHLVARAAALSLFYVADESTFLPMYRIAFDETTEEDVRAFLALTMMNLEHPMAAGLLKQLADTKRGRDVLAGPALMGLGYHTIEEDRSIPQFLYDVAFRRKDVRAAYRALAVESFGRIGDVELGLEPLLKGLQDRSADVRRSAAAALGVLAYRTPSERRIAGIRAPYEAFVDLPMTAEDEARVQALESLIPAERRVMGKPVKRIVKKLADAMRRDADAFTRRMAAISLGRLREQHPTPLVDRYLRDQVERGHAGMREYAILAMGISGTAETHELAGNLLSERNPSTRGAACIALGLLGNPDRDEPCSEALRRACGKALRPIILGDPHPHVRGYASIAAGMLGNPSAADPILKMVAATKTPVARGYGLLGLALLDSPAGAELLAEILEDRRQMQIPVVATHAIYALGFTKDRLRLDALLRAARDSRDPYAQASALIAIAYVCVDERFPLRHTMIRGHNHALGMEHLLIYFRKL